MTYHDSQPTDLGDDHHSRDQPDHPGSLLLLFPEGPFDLVPQPEGRLVFQQEGGIVTVDLGGEETFRGDGESQEGGGVG